MLIGIEGGLGSGKTLLMVRYLLKDFNKGNQIFSNFGLNHIPYKVLNVLEILDFDKENKSLIDISMGIDELTVFADCRTSIGKMNRLFSYFILQTRKRNVNLYYTTQNMMMIDKRVREHTDIQIFCEKIKDSDGEMIEKKRHYTIWDFRDLHDIPKPTKFILDISKYFDYYDTNEVILPPV